MQLGLVRPQPQSIRGLVIDVFDVSATQPPELPMSDTKLHPAPLQQQPRKIKIPVRLRWTTKPSANCDRHQQPPSLPTTGSDDTAGRAQTILCKSRKRARLLMKVAISSMTGFT
jgi:hypothetical protein